ncbi:MAG: hypothetical protein M3132_14995 [Actinomycetia bacterium]|nr:hypothetical protein [Actinomycetes bacterium]
MKKGILIILPVLLLGLSACSANLSNSSATPKPVASGTVTSGLEGVEFVVHRAVG